MFTSFVQIVAFAVETVFDIYILLLLLRLLLQISGANFFNPLVQWVLKLTNFLVKPVSRFIPRFRNVDYSIILIIWVLAALQAVIVTWIRYDIVPGILVISAWSVAEIGDQLINLYFYGILIYALMSWFQVQPTTPLYELLGWLCNPILRPVRKIIPMIGRFDFSPIIAMLILKLLQVFLIVPIIKWVLMHIVPI